jgi:hypothetical protein
MRHFSGPTVWVLWLVVFNFRRPASRRDAKSQILRPYLGLRRFGLSGISGGASGATNWKGCPASALEASAESAFGPERTLPLASEDGRVISLRRGYAPRMRALPAVLARTDATSHADWNRPLQVHEVHAVRIDQRAGVTDMAAQAN